VEWYLKKVTEHQQQTGLKLVDWLDLHYYPQANGVALSSDESAATSALRLRTIKSLYDPAYQDESWIPNAVRLIPRAKEWIAARAPGTKLAITEYSWGNDEGPSSALAQAEVLAVFGREGVDLATRWVSPGNTRVEDAFKLFLSATARARRSSASVSRRRRTSTWAPTRCGARRSSSSCSSTRRPR
jgi:hypothetical protein